LPSPSPRLPTTRLLAFALALGAGAPFGAACRRPSTPATPAPPSLLRLQPEGARVTALADERQTRRRAFSADVPSTLSWKIRLPPEARLETALSFVRRKPAEFAGVTCRVRVELVPEDGTPRVVLERRLEPHGDWDPYRADLGRWGGQEVVLSLAVDCRSRPGKRTWSDAVRWSVPVVSGPRPPGRRSLLLVTVDTLRADHLHAYGYSRPTSPHMDALARRGLLFEDAETVQSATWPALTTLHTSLYPSAHGVVENGHDLREGVPTLAELLFAKGYETAAFLTNMKRARHRGFALVSPARAGGQSADDREAVEDAIAELGRDRSRAFFIWVHLISPHASYDPPRPWDTAFPGPGASALSGDLGELVRLRERGATLSEADVARVVSLYDGEVAYTDDLVGRLLEAVRTLGLESSTLVVLTADHGEDLYEHNRYFFHSPSMYASSLHVPLILALPGVLPEGRSTDQPASLVDLAPTLLGLLGMEAPRSFQGENLLPGGALPREPVRRLLFSETNGRIYGVRTAGFRLVLNPGGVAPGAPGGAYPIAPVELFSRADDPREQTNVAAARPDVVRALSADVAEWRARDLPREQLPARAIDPETLKELRALGYVFD
jgi:arylsulfatase A-like enzyme